MKCPVCKAENVEGSACRRCKADLAPLFALEEQRRHALAEAYRAAAGGRWSRAILLVEGADALRSDDESRRFLAASYLMRRDFSRAWQYYSSRSRAICSE
jgi:hypothetical protein